ncbi:MAG TPA: hypothetical protein VGQ36_24940 [Thermoanaerobaculia bacterium]|jgi:hypothetical protein|nr:hypothetical protein [Thermoanaerobaculia bacterium]
MTTNHNDPDEFAVLAAIWILANNDENALITYRGVQHRLNLSNEFDVRGLVSRHGELFRLSMPESRLQRWREDMKAGKRLPSWIREMAVGERAQLIEALKPNDGFRSQFRSGDNAPKSEVAVIEWGLGHIERLRKARSEAREATVKSWQIWLVFVTSFLGVIATIVAALLKK